MKHSGFLRDVVQYPGLILACALTLSLSFAGQSAVLADGDGVDGQLGGEVWAFEYKGNQNDIDEYQIDSYQRVDRRLALADDERIAALFNTIERPGRSRGELIEHLKFECLKCDRRSQAQFLIESDASGSSDNLATLHQEGENNFANQLQFGTGNVAKASQRGP